VEGLAANMGALLRDPGLREAGRRARALVEERFSWRATFGHVFALYEALLRSPRRA
jgi:glycosyltransferase involved in cell wall biosynthesis